MKVSIIMPNYNGSQYIRWSIDSILEQSYEDWQLIIIDDCSKDNSIDIIENYNDNRITLLKNEVNSGVAESRNKGIQYASGEIIAFCDSDDIWYKKKLAEQVNVYKASNPSIVFTNYELIDSNGNALNKVIQAPHSVTYDDLLKSNYIGCSTSSYNVKMLGKRYFIKHGHEDYVLWLSILKEGNVAVNTNKCLAARRILSDSLSANKLKVIQWQWKIYRNVENLSLMKSMYYFCFYACNALKKQLGK